MANITFHGSYSISHWGSISSNVRLTFSESYSASNNKTTLTLTKLEFQLEGNSSTFSELPIYGVIKIGSTTVASIDNSTSGRIARVQITGSGFCQADLSGVDITPVTVTHNNDGSKSVTVSLEGGYTNGSEYFCCVYRFPYGQSGGLLPLYEMVPFGVPTTASASMPLTNRGYTLTTAVNNSGYGTVSAGATLAPNKTLEITATPADSTAQYSYSFTGWEKTSGSLSSTTVSPTTFTMGTANATVTAKFSRSTRSYTVTCEDRIGSSSGTKLGTKTGTYSYGASVSGASFGTNSDYGYYYTGYHYTGSSSSTTVSGNTTVYRYFAINTWTVAYNANGGSGAPSSQTKTYNTALTLSNTTPTRANASAGSYTVTYNINYSGGTNPTAGSAARTSSYTFSKWNTKSDGSGTSYNPGGSYTANAAATLYARWTSSTSTASVTLPTPTRSGYLLKGWYTAASGGTKVGNGGASYKPSGNVTLYAQWQAQISTISAAPASGSKCYFGSTINITISRNSSSFTHTVKASCAGRNVTLYTKTSTYPTVTWTPPLGTYGPLITDAMSATATITCDTYNGDTLLGSSTTTCTIYFASSDVKPAVSIATADPNGYLSTYGKFVKGKSKIRVTLTETLKYSATTVTRTITANGSTYTSSPATTDVISSTANTSVTAKIVDSRGQSVTQSTTIQIYDYTKPQINSFSVYRCNSDGTSNSNGAYARVNYNVTITALGNNNSKSLKIKYKKTTASSYTTKTVTLSSYSQSGNVHDIVADVDSSYNILLELADDFHTVSSSKVLPTVSTHVNHGAGINGGIGIGKVSEDNKTVDIADGWTTKVSMVEVRPPNYILRQMAVLNSGANHWLMRAKDYSGNYRGGLSIYRSDTYGDGLWINHGRTINGTTYTNRLALYIKDNGDPLVAFDSDATRAAWQSVLRTQYFAGDSVGFGTGSYAQFAGSMRGSNNFNFTIPLAKPVASGVTASVSGSIIVVESGGYHSMSDIDTDSNITLSCVINGGRSCVTVHGTWTTAPSWYTAQKPITVQAYGLTVSFS